ncbi:tRNA pseudouridine(55) synthase TruB [Alphaproteobacteria bacterium endosymbiont of Tiliacea citrago]|uniref:tRNA pseudouridine(55) synthase TruB n=1 Tax=Alphaproteobacteria bacterium endosymbiont of Tiliacea citrago TaxID=3077944 RepID=UPI00313B08B7
MSGCFFLLDKPLDVSSFFCIKPFKKNYKRVGHSGTLDPFATGLLVVAVERATKFIQYLPTSKKYFFSIQFGFKTDSDDVSGKVVEKNNKRPELKDIVSSIYKFIGLIEQRPNKFSAIKINGKRAYKLARNGVLFDIPKRNVFIHSLELISFEGDVASFEVVCEKGTYVRTLASDLCNSLSVLGCVITLRRIASNGFDLGLIEKATEGIGLDCFFEFYPSLFISFEQFEKLKNGCELSIKDDRLIGGAIYCLNLNEEFRGLVKTTNFSIKKLYLI